MKKPARFCPNCHSKAQRSLKTVIERTQPRIDAWLSEVAYELDRPDRPERWRPFSPTRREWLRELIEHPTTGPLDRGWHVEEWLSKLEARGWLVLDALRVIEAAINLQEVPTDRPMSNARLSDVLRCRWCKGRAPLAPRIDAKTCGKATCRAARARYSPAAAKHKGTSATSSAPSLPPPRSTAVAPAPLPSKPARAARPTVQRRPAVVDSAPKRFCACAEPFPIRHLIPHAGWGAFGCGLCGLEVGPDAQSQPTTAAPPKGAEP
jgi:hypothetical protein